jgi:hypothetical protein
MQIGVRQDYPLQLRLREVCTRKKVTSQFEWRVSPPILQSFLFGFWCKLEKLALWR